MSINTHSIAATDAPRDTYRIPQNVILIALGLFFSLAAAYRWLGTGRDYLEYLTYYNTIPPTFSFSDTRFEPGFHLIAWFFRVVLNINYAIFSFIIIGISLGIKFYVMRRYLSYPVLAAIIYLMMIYPLHEYTQIRAALSISVGFLAIHLWIDDRRLWAAIAICIAFLFHSSIVIFAACFMFAKYFRWNKQGLLLLLSIAAAISVMLYLNLSIVSLFSSYNPLLSNYLENITFEQETSVLSVASLMYIALIVAAIIGGWLKDGYRRPLIIMSIFSVVALAIFSSSPTVAQRTKEVLFGAIIFAAYRFPISDRDLPAIVLLLVNALALCWLSVQNGLILSA